ncbi:MAG: Branched-chain amino acid transport system permease protein LivM, partial [uncultured Thermomicrobiales bacterium]
DQPFALAADRHRRLRHAAARRAAVGADRERPGSRRFPGAGARDDGDLRGRLHRPQCPVGLYRHLQLRRRRVFPCRRLHRGDRDDAPRRRGVFDLRRRFRPDAGECSAPGCGALGTPSGRCPCGGRDLGSLGAAAGVADGAATRGLPGHRSDRDGGGAAADRHRGAVARQRKPRPGRHPAAARRPCRWRYLQVPVPCIGARNAGADLPLDRPGHPVPLGTRPARDPGGRRGGGGGRQERQWVQTPGVRAWCRDHGCGRGLLRVPAGGDLAGNLHPLLRDVHHLGDADRRRQRQHGRRHRRYLRDLGVVVGHPPTPGLRPAAVPRRPGAALAGHDHRVDDRGRPAGQPAGVGAGAGKGLALAGSPGELDAARREGDDFTRGGL